MESFLDKSASDSELNTKRIDTTPTGYVFSRFKRRREDDFNEGFKQELNNFKEEVKEMIKSLSTAQDTRLLDITEIQKEIRASNINTENCIALLTAQNEELKKKLDSLEIRSKEDRLHIASLENKIEDLQRSSRKTNFEIKNVPKREGESKEDLLEMVSCLTKNLGCSFDNAAIKDIFRVRGKKGKTLNTPIVVEISSTLQRGELLKKCKEFNYKNKAKLCAKHLGLRTSEDTPIFVSEQLTAKGSRLFFLARDLAKTKQYKYCWTSFGKVYLRKDDNSPYVEITSESQAHQLGQ